MKTKLDQEFVDQILSIVEEIPYGKVTTYGQIARLSGYDKNARLIGRVLKMSELYGNYPCHRVLNHQGNLVPSWKEQKQLLEEEGIKLKDDNKVDLKIYQWNI